MATTMANDCPQCQQDFKQHSSNTNHYTCLLCKTKWTVTEHRFMPCQKCGQEIDCNSEINLHVPGYLGPWHACQCGNQQSSYGLTFKSIVSILNDDKATPNGIGGANIPGPFREDSKELGKKAVNKLDAKQSNAELELKMAQIKKRYELTQEIKIDSKTAPQKLTDTKVLLGKTLDEARKLYEYIRVVKIDYIPQMVHDDVQPYRLNVATVQGRISQIMRYN